MKHDTLAPWAQLVPGAPRMTADELLAVPEDEWQYELVEGRLVRVSPTGLEHYYVTDMLHTVMRRHALERQLGLVTLPDTGFVLSRPGEPDTVLSPDIAYLSTARVQQLPARGTQASKKFLPVAPDLAVEIASPDQYHPEMAEKARLYLASGVRLVWIVWPAQKQVDVWRPGHDAPGTTLNPGDALDGEDVLPAFAYAVADLFG
jgi:Uma2 family endonuclease